MIAGAGAAGEWNEYLLFRNHRRFGIKDPQFDKDIGFYVFQLPFLSWVVGWLFAAFVIVFIVTAVAHYLNGGIRVQTPFQRVTPQVKAHLSVLLGVLALVKAAGYYLQQFSLSTSTRGTVDGPTYTDVHAQLPAIRLLLVISLSPLRCSSTTSFGAAGCCRCSVWACGRSSRWSPARSFPAFIQKFRVEPSESSKERPYIERNIEATQGGDEPRQRHGEGLRERQPAEHAKRSSTNQTTVRNIRLWDPSPNISLKTYQTLQALKPFYKIDDVDVDRYVINGAIDPGAAVFARVEHRAACRRRHGRERTSRSPTATASCWLRRTRRHRRVNPTSKCRTSRSRTPPAFRSTSPTSTSVSTSTATSCVNTKRRRDRLPRRERQQRADDIQRARRHQHELVHPPCRLRPALR